MKPLNSADILALHTIARSDKRLGRDDRVALADIAREGRIGARYSNPSGTRRVEKLRTLGYLPAVTA